MKQKLTDFEKRRIAEKYHSRLMLSHVLILASVFIMLAIVSSISKLTEFYFQVGVAVGTGGITAAFILKHLLSKCPFCSHQLFHPGRRIELYAHPAQCPKCGEKLF